MTFYVLDRRIRVSQVVRFTVLVVLSVAWLLPILWLLATSIKPENQIIQIPPRWLPDDLSMLTLKHYYSVLFEPRRLSIGRAFLNTMQLCVVIPTIGAIVSSLAAYAFAPP